jgi:hypothetical protein
MPTYATVERYHIIVVTPIRNWMKMLEWKEFSGSTAAAEGNLEAAAILQERDLTV